jgi:hypothetical protein
MGATTLATKQKWEKEKKRGGLGSPEKQTEIHTITPACTDRPSSFVVVVCKPFKSLRQRGHLVLLSVKVDNEELPDEALAKVFQVRVTAVPLAEPLPHLLFQVSLCTVTAVPLARCGTVHTPRMRAGCERRHTC